jgi:hypothetical protein
VVTRVLLVGAGSLITVAGVVFALQGAGVIGGSFMSGTTTWAVAGPLIALAGLALVVLGLIVPGLRRRLPPRRRLLGQFLIARGQPAPQFDVPELSTVSGLSSMAVAALSVTSRASGGLTVSRHSSARHVTTTGPPGISASLMLPETFAPLSILASSCARTTTRRARSVNRWNIVPASRH